MVILPSGTRSRDVTPGGGVLILDPAAAGTHVTSPDILGRVNFLHPDGDSVLAGSGDWSSNSGPTALVRFTSAAAVTLLSAIPSEALDLARTSGTVIDLPLIDPTPGRSAGGWVTNATGAWTVEDSPNMVHTFDVLRVGGDLYLSGQQGTTPVVLRRTSSGVWSDTGLPGDGQVRSHGVAHIDGAVLASNGVSVYEWRTSAWSARPDLPPAAFGHYAVRDTHGGLWSSTAAVTAAGVLTYDNVRPQCESAGFIYAIRGDREIVRAPVSASAGPIAWELVGRVFGHSVAAFALLGSTWVVALTSTQGVSFFNAIPPDPTVPERPAT